MTVPVPYSYRQYAGNGSNKDFAVPFPYLEKAHVHVYLGFNLLDGTFTSELAETSGFTWTSGTVIRAVTAPATGATLTVIRQTPNGQQLVEWVDGSNLISADLNTSDKQNLYVVQEQQDRNDGGITQSTAAKTAATAATTAANAATTAANTATSTANTALSTANTASTNASAAVTTANTASTNASAAVTTANSANTTAGTANTNAAAAVTTANAANTKADSAINAVASSVNYTPIGNVAGIPSTPANNTYIEIADSTGLQSFTPLSGMPAGFIGDAGLSVRLRYTTSPATWNWLNYYANNADSRYLKLAGGTLTGALTLAANPASALQPATKAYTDAADATLTTAAANAQSTASAALPKAGGTMTGAITFAGGQSFPGAVTSVSGTAPVSVTAGTTPTVSVSAASTSASGVAQLSDSTSSTSSSTAATSAAVKAVQDFAQTVSSVANAALPKSGGTMTGAITFAGGQSFPGAALTSNILYNRRPALHRGSLFYKTAATTISIVAGAVLNGLVYSSATAVTMPSHSNNTDYAIWQNPTTGALVGDASFTTAPAGATGGSVVGGYHYIPSGRPTAVNNGSPTSAAEILEFSLWDLTWRPVCPDPRGMACIEGGFWGDLYLVGATSYAGSSFSAVPSSRIGLTIADGSSLPLVPAQFGGNGSTAYPDGKWYVFSELARSFGKRLLSNDEYSAGAFGAPEASSRGTDPGTVQWERVSKFGWAQATGVMWHWGAALSGSGSGGTWQTGVTAGRGDVYSSDARAVLLGGSWGDTSISGSRCASWVGTPWFSLSNGGARFAAGHLVLG